ncbi:MAG: nucleotidyltransferase domain-containing protein [Candidatus Aenigmarchaeota archaeon]|nr:nucleotidyltransferase domain-containing protein [Candidatus Aenigmarchaeota archaeon]
MVDLLRYALQAAAHLLCSLSAAELKRLRSLLLFGSVAQGVATADSDVDLFFDVDMPKTPQQALRAKLYREAERFSATSMGLEFKVMGVDNDLSIRVGKLEEWPDLAQSISSSGIVLYQRYAAEPPGLKAYTLFSWEHPGAAKGALLNKLYGYRLKGTFHPGLLQKAKGVKVGRGAILVPAACRDQVADIFERYKLSYSRSDVWAR